MFIEVILPLKLTWAPTYRADAQIFRGQRVRVRFARKEYVGVVSRTDVHPDFDTSKILDIMSVEDRLPPISEAELGLWEFMAGYYLCSIGEVYKAAYPSLKLRSEEVVAAAGERKETGRLKKLEVMQARVSRLQIRLKAKEAAIAAKKEGTRARAGLEEGREKILAELKAARAAVENFLPEESEVQSPYKAGADAKPAAGKPILLHGDMLSRAAEYTRLLNKTLTGGGQALVLCPEKALCSCLKSNLALSLSDRNSGPDPESPSSGLPILLCNSDCTATARRKVADALRAGSPAVVLGNRSCIFLPLSNLQLIIIDEEQDPSYKQTEPAPRYNGRDCALALGSIHSAQVVLGSASPSLETELNVLSGKFQRQELDCSPNGNLEIIDVSAERRKNGMLGALSRKLLAAVEDVDGKVVFVRGWESAGEIEAQCESILGAGKVQVMSLPELKRDAPSDISLLAVLQADAFLSKDDFRSDERAVQLVALLKNFSPSVIVQTAVAERFSGTRSIQDLLKERKDFKLPPFSRAMDVLFDDANEGRKKKMMRLLAGAAPGAMVMQDRIRWNLPRGTGLPGTKRAIATAVASLESTYKYTGHTVIDVDPA